MLEAFFCLLKLSRVHGITQKFIVAGPLKKISDGQILLDTLYWVTFLHSQLECPNVLAIIYSKELIVVHKLAASCDHS